MAKKPKKTTTLAEIEEAFVTEGTAFFESFRRKKAKETVYAFLFELSAVGYYAGAAIATEEGLARSADDVQDSFDGDLEQAKSELRWGSLEDGWLQSTDKQFRATNELLERAEETELYPEYDGTLEKVAAAALQRMIDAGVFGSADERERLVVGLCHTGGDNSEQDFLRWAKPLNSASVLKRLKAELKRCRA